MTRSPRSQEPVACTSATRGSASRVSPTVLPGPIASPKIPSASVPRVTSWKICCTATEISGVRLEGFQRMLSPHTAASAHPHPGTATGKLKAEMMPTMPSGCHCSVRRCCFRSECIWLP